MYAECEEITRDLLEIACSALPLDGALIQHACLLVEHPDHIHAQTDMNELCQSSQCVR